MQEPVRLPRQRDKDGVSFGRPQKLAPEQKTRALLLVPKQIPQRSRPGWPFRLSAPEKEDQRREREQGQRRYADPGNSTFSPMPATDP